MSQADFKFKDNYKAFLEGELQPQLVVDFIVHVSTLPNPTLEDIQAVIEACERVRDTHTQIKKLGYFYNSQFIIYEQLFWYYQHQVFGKTLESFKKTVEIGVKAIETLKTPGDAQTMGLRTEVLLRNPERSGFPSYFRCAQKASEIKQKRLKGHFNHNNCYNSFREFDLREAQTYTKPGSRNFFYCKLYLEKDKEALAYFQQQWKSNPSVSIGCNYLQGLEYVDADKAKEFQRQLENYIHEKGNAQGFTHWARMNLKRYSHINDFVVIPDILAGTDEPSAADVGQALRHCDLGLQKIAKMQHTGPFEYRNRVFLLETKGWIFAHLLPKSFENYSEALRNYKEALSLYVYVKNYHVQLQFVLHRYQHILKEVLILLSSPSQFDFPNTFRYEEKTEQLYQDYLSMLDIPETGFPHLKQLRQAFSAAAKRVK